MIFGYNNREIAEKLGLSRSGTAYHVRKLLERFDAVNRTELAVRYATQEGGQ
jgi:DNA-binding CsgD family transcriptional regulator